MTTASLNVLLRSGAQRALLAVLLISPGFECCTSGGHVLERIQQSGVLRVATRNGPTTFYEGPRGLAGFEHDLATLFGQSLDVEIEFKAYKTFDEIQRALERGKVDIAAAGLAMSPERESKLRFSPSYQRTSQQVVYRIGNLRPRVVEDLLGRRIEVVAGSTHEKRLMVLAETLPDLEWGAAGDTDSDELLMRVSSGDLDLTIAWSNEVALNRRHHPELGVAFDLTEPLELAWAYQHSDDSTLAQAVGDFFERIRADGRLSHLQERYYGFVARLSTVDAYRFKRHVQERLPEYRDLFVSAAGQTGLDWRLLAAIGYQESHWNPLAVSPTGVRGMMMLTQLTASELGVTDRLDPAQSISGGAVYMQQLVDRVPSHIEDPDRIWLALAGYNVGFGHLDDARELTRRDGGNPDRWSDIKSRLPLLQKEKWYSRTRHGYARGAETVDFVDSIRNYYDLLVRMSNADEIPEFAEPRSADLGDDVGES